MIASGSNSTESSCKPNRDNNLNCNSDLYLNKKIIFYNKCALFLSIFTLIIVLIVFYSLSRNMEGITNKIVSFESLEQNTDSLNRNMKNLSIKIATLEDYASRQKLTEQILRSAMREILIDQATSQLEYVASQLKEDDTDADLQAAITLLQKNKKKQQGNTQITKPEPTP